MEQSALLAPVVRFGDCEVDIRAGEIRNGDATAQLQEQPLQILVMLLGHHGELVTREELRKALWPGDTFVNFEDSLNHAIRRLRDVLGDSADKPRFIETLPRRGYRFIAPLEPAEAVREPPPRKRWVLAWGGLALIALVAVLAGLYVVFAAVAAAAAWFGHVNFSGAEQPLQAVPLTSYPGEEYFPSLSPDGNQVAFTWRKQNQ